MSRFLQSLSIGFAAVGGIMITVVGCAREQQIRVVCTQSMKNMWQATAVYQADHGENGDLLGFPPPTVAFEMVREMYVNPCEEPRWHRYFAKNPYLYLPRASHRVYGELLIPSFRERRMHEGESATLWSCMNHNDDVPAMVDTYPYRSSEISREGTLRQPTNITGAWWQPHSKFWDREENYWMNQSGEN